MQLSLSWSIDDSFINSQMSSVVYSQPSGRAAPGKSSKGRPEAHSESEEDSDESDDEVSDDEDAPLPGELDDDDSDVADEDAVDIDSEEEDLPEADDDDAEESDEQEEQQIEESESDAEDVPRAQPQANGRSAVTADVDEEESGEGGSLARFPLHEHRCWLLHSSLPTCVCVGELCNLSWPFKCWPFKRSILVGHDIS